MTYCFLNSSIPCTERCKAYTEDQEPSCMILLFLLASSKYLDSARQTKAAEVKYPASPPAPEVR